MRLELFDKLPDWVIGSYGYFTALGTGSAGLGAAVVHSIVRRDPGPDYIRLIGIFLTAIFLMIVAVILIDRYLVPKPSPVLPPPSPSVLAPKQPRTFSHPDVRRLGAMIEISVTVTDNSNGKGTYNIRFKWTGSGGSWKGSQSTTIIFKGANNASLQSVVIPINRGGCYYGGGNLQTKDGDLIVDPSLITGVDVTLSEVSGEMGPC
jgi:hypothetical protein